MRTDLTEKDLLAVRDHTRGACLILDIPYDDFEEQVTDFVASLVETIFGKIEAILGYPEVQNFVSQVVQGAVAETVKSAAPKPTFDPLVYPRGSRSRYA